MSKPNKTIGAWLSEVFGTSHKAISENLTAEQYSQLVADAGKFRDSQKVKNVDTTDDDDDDDDDDHDDDDDNDQDDDETTDPKNVDPKKTTLEARLTALEAGLGLAQKALKQEKKTNKTLATKLEETQTKLDASEKQRKKLRQSVNLLGDEDVTGAETQNTGLTQVDIEARASYARSKAEE